MSVFLNEGILFQSLADRNRANHCDYATTLVHGARTVPTSSEAHVPKWPRFRCNQHTHPVGRGRKGLKTVGYTLTGAARRIEGETCSRHEISRGVESRDSSLARERNLPIRYEVV